MKTSPLQRPDSSQSICTGQNGGRRDYNTVHNRDSIESITVDVVECFDAKPRENLGYLDDFEPLNLPEK